MGGDVISNILLSVVDDLVDVGVLQAPVAAIFVRVDFAARLDVLADFLMQRGPLGVRNHRGLDPALAGALAAFQQAHDGRLARAPGPGNFASLDRLMHEPGLAADKGLVGFDLAREGVRWAVLHGIPNAMQHEPCRLLGDAQRTVQLVAGDAVLAVGQQPDRGQPLAQGERAVLHDRPHFNGELLPSVFALAAPEAARGQIPGIIPATGRTAHAIRPAHRGEGGKRPVLVTEIRDGFLEGLRGRLCHVSSVAKPESESSILLP